MSPIKPENARRYPEDWRDLADEIKFVRAGGRCECEGECGRGHLARCPNEHERPAYGTGSIVVLTVAHLVAATQLPVLLHVARAAERDQVVEVVGEFVVGDVKGLEGPQVMYDRALAEFLGGSATSGARFVITLVNGSLRGEPGGAVALGAAAAGPEMVLLSGWCLLSPPGEAAGVAAESSAGSGVVARHEVGTLASLANGSGATTLGAAYRFTATGVRASAATVRGLLRCQRDGRVADDAFDLRGRAAGTGHALHHIGYLPENCDESNLRAMCQGCHLHYDRDHHRQSRILSERAALEASGQMSIEDA